MRTSVMVVGIVLWLVLLRVAMVPVPAVGDLSLNLNSVGYLDHCRGNIGAKVSAVDEHVDVHARRNRQECHDKNVQQLDHA